MVYLISGLEYCNNTLSAEGDILQSSNFPDEYDNNALCKNLIQAPDGYQVRLNFTHFYLEEDKACLWDSLKVYDGPDESSHLIGTYCGKASPWIIRSSGRYLYVVFISDGSVTYTGYQATVSFAGEYFEQFTISIWVHSESLPETKDDRQRHEFFAGGSEKDAS